MSHVTRSRVLVIGASGQVGRALCAAFADSEITAAGHQHAAPGQRTVDLADPDTIRAVIRDVRPRLVLLAGGMCHVDGCELDPARCRAINVDGTRVVAETAQVLGACVVFFSTDHVFDGERDNYREADAEHPLNVYSASKVDAERALRLVVPHTHLILRTSSVYGIDAHRRNFVVRLVDRVSEGHTVMVPRDQWGSPTFAGDLAVATKRLVEQEARGTFHACGPDYLDRAAFAYAICDVFGLEPALIQPCATAALNQAAPRARGVRLDCGKLIAAGVPPFTPIEAGLRKVREAMFTHSVH